jgi:hypothetical protein
MRMLLLACLIVTLTGCEKTIHEARVYPVTANGLR